MPSTDRPRNDDEPRHPDRRELRAKAVARGRVEAMRRRARRIRRTVAATTVALFVAAFLGVYVQLASGHDPALDAAAKRAVATTPSAKGSQEVAASGSSSEAEAASSGSVESSTGESESSSAGSESSSGGEEGSGESSSPSAVTTGQS